MIDLNARIKTDSQKIHQGTLGAGSFATDITITRPDGSDSLTITGLYNDISIAINPQTGMPIVGSTIAISVHLDDFTTWDRLESLDRWRVSFVDNSGLNCIGEMINAMPDFTFGDLFFSLQLDKGKRT